MARKQARLDQAGKRGWAGREWEDEEGERAGPEGLNTVTFEVRCCFSCFLFLGFRIGS